MHPRTGHTWSLLSGERQASRLRAVPAFHSLISRDEKATEHELLPFEINPRCVPMNRITLSLLLAAGLLAMSSGVAQTPDANQEAKLLALIKEVQTQQAQMTDNEAKIETQLTDLTETIRVARILAGKIGK
jgi:septal ring factor EnvC (AmiA/AmiB activator)